MEKGVGCTIPYDSICTYYFLVGIEGEIFEIMNE